MSGYAVGLHELMASSAASREAHTCGREGYYVHPRYFEHLAVCDYYLADAAKYEYSLSRCNEFYRALLAPVWNQ